MQLIGAASIGDGLWRTFGQKILELFYKKAHFRYNFGMGRKDVRRVCKYYKEKLTHIRLSAIIEREKLRKQSDLATMRSIMNWVNSTYPSKYFYLFDKSDRWNHPSETLDSFEARKRILDNNKKTPVSVLKKRKAWIVEQTTDCDDYAILIYNLARVANIPAENMRLCFMKTMGEWHMNLMYFHKGRPFVVEGTYYPILATRAFGKKSYFQITLYHAKKGKLHIYWFIKWLWNENVVRYNHRTAMNLLR